MSLQFNFFALASDYELILASILHSIPGALVFPGWWTSGTPCPRELRSPEDLLIPENVVPAALVAPDSLASLRLRAVPDGSRIDFRASPVLEWFPSLLVSHETVKVGRIAFFCEDCGEASGLERSVRSLFRALKKHAQRVPGGSQFWIFRQAAAEARWLEYWVGEPEPSTFFAR